MTSEAEHSDSLSAFRSCPKNRAKWENPFLVLDPILVVSLYSVTRYSTLTPLWALSVYCVLVYYAFYRVYRERDSLSRARRFLEYDETAHVFTLCDGLEHTSMNVRDISDIEVNKSLLFGERVCEIRLVGPRNRRYWVRSHDCPFTASTLRDICAANNITYSEDVRVFEARIFCDLAHCALLAALFVYIDMAYHAPLQ